MEECLCSLAICKSVWMHTSVYVYVYVYVCIPSIATLRVVCSTSLDTCFPVSFLGMLSKQDFTSFDVLLVIALPSCAAFTTARTTSRTPVLKHECIQVYTALSSIHFCSVPHVGSLISVFRTPSCFQSSSHTICAICFPGPSARQEPQIPTDRGPALLVSVVVSCLFYFPFLDLGSMLSARWTGETAGSSWAIMNWTLGNKMSTRLCLCWNSASRSGMIAVHVDPPIS